MTYLRMNPKYDAVYLYGNLEFLFRDIQQNFNNDFSFIHTLLFSRLNQITEKNRKLETFIVVITL